jgi:hypothetical protein
MKTIMFRRAAMFVLMVSLSLYLCGCVIYDNKLSFKTSEGKVITVNYGQVAEEELSGGEIKTCICKAVHFRALQLAASMWENGQIRVDSLKMASGINTDGPEEFKDVLEERGVEIDPIDVDESIDGNYLGLNCYSVLVTNTATGKQCRISSRAELFSGNGFDHMDFFELRTKVKMGKATNEEKQRFKNIVRPGVVQNLTQVPIKNMFEVALVTNPQCNDWKSNDWKNASDNYSTNYNLFQKGRESVN